MFLITVFNGCFYYFLLFKIKQIDGYLAGGQGAFAYPPPPSYVYIQRFFKKFFGFPIIIFLVEYNPHALPGWSSRKF